MSNSSTATPNDNASRVRVAKRSGYTIIPNGLLPEGKISARSWGIYAYLLSRPDGWEVRASHLATVFKEGRDAIYKALKELVAAGLMELESYRNEDGLPRKRYVLLSPESVLYPPNTAFQDTAFQDTENTGEVITDLTTTELNQDLSVTSSNKFDDQIKESDTGEQVRPAKNPQGINSTGLTKKQRDPMRNQLVKIGHLMKDGASFYDDVVQDEWYDFGRLVEATLPDHFDMTGLADLIDNLKSSVDAKCVDPLVAGKRLTSIINTGLKY